MKLKKPEDEKYFKDIVLNDILEEISNEVGEPLNPSQEKKGKSSTKILTLKKILSLIFILLLILFIGILFKLVTEASTEQTPTEITKVVDEEDWKMESDRTALKKNTPMNTFKKPTLPKMPIPPSIIETQIQKPDQLKQTNVKTERERAKDALKEQMLH